MRTKLRFTVSAQYQTEHTHRERFTVNDNFAFSRRTDNYDEVVVIGAAVDGETKVASWLSLSYGLDVYNDLVYSRATAQRAGETVKDGTPNFPEGGRYTTLGGFVVGNLRAWSWAKGSGLFVHAGIRLNGFFAYASARGEYEEVQFNQFGYAPFVSLQALIGSSLNISASYSQGFRAPNLQETSYIGDAGNDFEVPNPNLRPEIAHTLELTVRGRWRRRFSGFVTGYTSFWSDLIDKAAGTYLGQSTFDGNDVVQRVNTANATVMGIEAGAAVRIWRGLSLQGSLNWTRGVVPQANGAEAPMSRIPPVFGRAALRYQFPKWAFVEFYVLFAGEQTAVSDRDKGDPRIPVRDTEVPSRVFDGTPGWATLNLRGGVQFPRLFRLFVTVENLLDTRYKYHTSGVYAPGFNARVTLELRL